MGLLLLVGVLASVALAGSASALSVAHVVPPPGTPDLSQMVLQPSDFSRAGSIQQDAYTTPSPPVVASYTRTFGPSTLGRTHFLTVESDAHLTTDSGTGALVFQVLNGLVRTNQGRRMFAQGFIQGVNQGAHKRVLTVRNVHFLRVHSLGVGNGSFLLPASAPVNGLMLSFDVVGVRVDRALGVLFLGTIGNIRRADARALARAIANHMQTTLAASPTSTTANP